MHYSEIGIKLAHVKSLKLVQKSINLLLLKPMVFAIMFSIFRCKKEFKWNFYRLLCEYLNLNN